MAFWDKKTFCVIAGASRGIGQGIAVSFSRRLQRGSVILLLSRSQSGLDTTVSMILSDQQSKLFRFSVITHSIDLSVPDKDQLTAALLSGFKESHTNPSCFEQFILVQNATSPGLERDFTFTTEIDDASFIKKELDFSLISFILLNSIFASIAKNGKCMIVHISSHASFTPIKTWGLYCATRAAKEMLLRSIALESPHIQTLNYAPGFVDTDLYSEAIKLTKDPEMVKLLTEEKAAGNLITPLQTAERLADILEMEKFVKGEHLAYYDEMFSD